MQHRGSPAAFMRLECVAQRWWDTTRKGLRGRCATTDSKPGGFSCLLPVMARSRLAGMALVGCVVLALARGRRGVRRNRDVQLHRWRAGIQSAQWRHERASRSCRERGRHGTGRGAWRQGSGRWRRTVGQTRRSALCRGRRSAFQRWRRHVRRGRQRRRGVRRQDGLDWRRTEPRQRSIAGALGRRSRAAAVAAEQTGALLA